MPHFRKKPVVIEAMQLVDNLGNHHDIAKWIASCGGRVVIPGLDPYLLIETLEGDMRADIGDWVIRGVRNEFYPCKPDVFEATYEPADWDGPEVLVTRPVPVEAPADLGQVK